MFSLDKCMIFIYIYVYFASVNKVDKVIHILFNLLELFDTLFSVNRYKLS